MKLFSVGECLGDERRVGLEVDFCKVFWGWFKDNYLVVLDLSDCKVVFVCVVCE